MNFVSDFQSDNFLKISYALGLALGLLGLSFGLALLGFAGRLALGALGSSACTSGYLKKKTWDDKKKIHAIKIWRLKNYLLGAIFARLKVILERKKRRAIMEQKKRWAMKSQSVRIQNKNMNIQIMKWFKNKLENLHEPMPQHSNIDLILLHTEGISTVQVFHYLSAHWCHC